MTEPERPNVLLIMADQWRGDCLGSAGHPTVRTPFLDRLASQGTRYAKAYSATPTCTPARASLMTGLRPATHGRVGYADHVAWDYPTTLAGEFTRHGYQTQAVGKMHVSPERAQLGFQNVVLHSPLGIVRSARERGQDPDLVDDYLPWLRLRLGRDATFFDHGIDSNSWVARPWDKPEHLHPTNFVASESADFLRRRDPTKPFLLFASFNAPHPPFDPPAWAFEQYLETDMPDPPVGDWAEAFDPWANSADPTALVGTIPPDLLQRARAGYYGHMTHVDQQINFLLEELSHRGLRDNTLVCFLADHGEMLGDHHLFRKGFPYEGSARIPMILSGPGVPAGQVRDDVVELGDVMPTLLDAAGLPVPDVVQGRSFLPATLDRAEPRAWLHGEHTLLGQSFQWLTDGHEKYVWWSGTGREQLFDLDSDPTESHDLAPSPGASARLERWREVLVGELRGREEGFTEGGRLVVGRPVRPTLRHPISGGAEPG
ncbi:sulfatase [Beutenbergia cavernae DSM 12333]|uniref:Sulfatase n=1 Tax=Beutenbergia cavernae (strain ATCC BAA-8 / DSM 12333 / CCUG 43141 / JCM 11478 / NBRC 16432 / NCIMB 13614 / HKI 0122) TaxID=471853 RepID=C5C1U1_BEUC1|nr:arylsulfatase [Beutenbergia cavernae]ACQ79559.1 sulfatase [Beutenbergia cavernae DSM 12333]